jgi:hypothetical protein
MKMTILILWGMTVRCIIAQADIAPGESVFKVVVEFNEEVQKKCDISLNQGSAFVASIGNKGLGRSRQYFFISAAHVFFPLEREAISDCAAIRDQHPKNIIKTATLVFDSGYAPRIDLSNIRVNRRWYEEEDIAVFTVELSALPEDLKALEIAFEVPPKNEQLTAYGFGLRDDPLHDPGVASGYPLRSAGRAGGNCPGQLLEVDNTYPAGVSGGPVVVDGSNKVIGIATETLKYQGSNKRCVQTFHVVRSFLTQHLLPPAERGSSLTCVFRIPEIVVLDDGSPGSTAWRFTIEVRSRAVIKTVDIPAYKYKQGPLFGPKEYKHLKKVKIEIGCEVNAPVTIAVSGDSPDDVRLRAAGQTVIIPYDTKEGNLVPFKVEMLGEPRQKIFFVLKGSLSTGISTSAKSGA